MKKLLIPAGLILLLTIGISAQASALIPAYKSWLLNGLNSIYTLANVGIGTSTPQAKLDVNGTALVSGNVGIGTTNPQAKLVVNGQIDVSNNKIIGLAAPANSSDAVNKGYVDSLPAFGGLYQTLDSPTGACNSPNPFTGACSCPPGFNDNAGIVANFPTGSCGWYVGYTAVDCVDRTSYIHQCWK